MIDLWRICCRPATDRTVALGDTISSSPHTFLVVASLLPLALPPKRDSSTFDPFPTRRYRRVLADLEDALLLAREAVSKLESPPIIFWPRFVYLS
jgi:hypothetical protein